MKQVKGESTSILVQILFMAFVADRAIKELAVLGLSVPQGQVRSAFTPSLAKSDLGSLHALQLGHVWVHFMFCRQIRSRFSPCLAGRSSESVGLSVGWEYDAVFGSGSLQVE